jgi:GntR family transcriptional regulator/MocR family aminotransferase
MLLLNLQASGGPLYRRIYLSLKDSIRAGRIAPATRLPSTRALAEDLGVSRNTVLLAYEQLAAEGYLLNRDRAAPSVAPARMAHERKPEADTAAPPRLSAYARRLAGRVGSGSFAARPGIRYDFRYGRPALDEFPREIWRRLLAGQMRRPSRDALGYASPQGDPALRRALADYLGRARGMSCDAEQVVIVNGAQQGIDLVSRVLLDEGDTVVVEDPQYPGATVPFEAAGAALARVPVDASGLQTDRLPQRARLAYVTPCHQFPSGVILPLARRLALLAWAKQAGAWIVEDDYVSEFRYEGHPLEALQALDRGGRVIYVGTFAKTLFPALRLGYLVLPRPLVRPFLDAKWAADRFSPTLEQRALAQFIADGQFERYLRRAGNRNAARRRTLIASLRRHFGAQIEIAGENTGVHLLVWLNEVPAAAAAAFIERAARAGVGLYSIAPFFSQPQRRAGLLFGYASLSEAEIRAGVRALAEAVL